ncbi:DUF6161 domain-containing protein [Kangiella sp.]|uniref:DUF6161 domain-containing protein n=1 Tax=Kangiella sp. TaxID=1920245 RepID=UPI003A90ADF4
MSSVFKISIRDVSGITFEFSSLKSFIKFAKSEIEKWEEYAERVKSSNKRPHGLINFYNNFHQALSTIDNWGESVDKWSEQDLLQNFNTHITNQSMRHAATHWLSATNEGAEVFVGCNCDYDLDGADAFYKILYLNQVHHPLNNRNVFMGTLIGYEFIQSDSEMVSRRNGEKISLGHLRSQFLKETDELIGEVDDIKHNYNEWFDKSLDKAKQALKVSNYLGIRQRSRHEKQFDENLRSWSQSVNTLEETYYEKLRLDGPAKYWNRSAKKYRKQGFCWLAVLIVFLACGIFGIYTNFNNWLLGKALEVNLSSLQGIVIFGTLATMFAYLIRTFSKLAFSSFHLMRDSEEREQLTYLYLALKNESAVEEQDRALILQSLFSRTDNGLLGGDSSPTMPGAADIVNLASRLGKK